MTEKPPRASELRARLEGNRGPFGEETLRALKALEQLENAEDRARDYLASEPNCRAFFGIGGIRAATGTSLDLDELFMAHLAPVPHPPGIVHISIAADPKQTDYLAAAHLAEFISCELSLTPHSELSEEQVQEANGLVPDIVWTLVALLKIQGHDSLFCPAFANRSWNVIPAAPKESVRFKSVDRVPFFVSAPREITPTEFQWAIGSCLRTMELRHSRRFGLALNTAYTWNHVDGLRACMGNLWVGLEALFGTRDDLKKTKGTHVGTRIS